MGGKRRKGARLEMTSLMDVMFLVLVFFIYCIFDMAVHKGLKVDLPNAAGADEKGERIVVTIRAERDADVARGGRIAREGTEQGQDEPSRAYLRRPQVIPRRGDRTSLRA